MGNGLRDEHSGEPLDRSLITKPKRRQADASGSKSPRDGLTAQRVRLRDAGFAPIPVRGKKPPFLEWQKRTGVTDAEIEAWRKYKGTGLLTRLMPTLDVDIYNPEAAKEVEELVRERFDGRGRVLVRVGNAPKRAIPFRTDKPFKKITANLIAPEGDTTIPHRMRGGVLQPIPVRAGASVFRPKSAKRL
jgi:hypothetical protein